jgi:hypothetical protein
MNWPPLVYMAAWKRDRHPSDCPIAQLDFVGDTPDE